MVGIAHSHPYFKTGKTRHARYSSVLLDTKKLRITIRRQGAHFIANPYPNLDEAARLVFSIVNVRQAADAENYQCTLIAKEGGQEIWSAHVTTKGTGQFGGCAGRCCGVCNARVPRGTG